MENIASKNEHCPALLLMRTTSTGKKIRTLVEDFLGAERTSDEPVLRCSGGYLEQVEPVRRKKWRRPGCVGRRVTLEIPASGWLRCPSMPFQRLAQFAEEDSQTNSFPTEMKAASQVQLFVCLSTTSTLCAWLWLWLWLFHSTPSMCFILNFGNEKFCAGGWQSTTERRLETKGIIWSLPIQLLDF